jgi:23S rRNA (pseudouridine1915-N3)-methyltransferase
MKINIVTVGTLKEKYLLEACKEYLKRISRFHVIDVIEVEEYKLPKNPSELDISKGLVKEGERIEKYLKGYIVVMDIDGKQMNSVTFAKEIEKTSLNFDTITFVIGGSNGLCESLKGRANLKFSFSQMTFPHQLFRVMLLEQIYRACTISNNIIYHK